MLSQSQFFDPSQFDPDPNKLDFNQFKARADYFHGTRHTNDWDPNTHLSGDATHAGTVQAASDRISSFANPNARVYPLRHVGTYAAGPVRKDASNAYDLEAVMLNKTIRYKNDVEDAGSISVVAPANHFQTYRQYVDQVPAKTEKQRLETGRGSVQHFHPGNYQPLSWIPGERSFNTHLDEQAREHGEGLITNPGPWSTASYSWSKTVHGNPLSHPGDVTEYTPLKLKPGETKPAF